MSQKIELPLQDGSGGLNTKDPKSGIAKNQFSRLENYLTDVGAYLTKRFGQDLIQYAPIDPQVFVNDVNTMGLWHLNEGADPYVDEATVPHNLTASGNNPPTQVTGLFSSGQQFHSIDGSSLNRGGYLIAGIGTNNLLNGKAACTYDLWIKINASYSGRPVTSFLTGLSMTNNNVSLLATRVVGSVIGPVQSGNTTDFNGLTIHRDWDFENSKNAGDPYVKFRIQTNGIAGMVTTIRSGALPTDRWLHLRATYNSSTSLVKLYVNGTLSAQASAVGGGTVRDPGGNGVSSTSLIMIGEGIAANIDPSTGAYTGTTEAAFRPQFDGIVDEARISDIDRSSEPFPFKNPRGSGAVLEKADGTAQVVCVADEGLYYTQGNLEWTPITAIDPANGNALSSTADWNGVQINDRLYLTNGVNTPLTWDGSRIVPTGEGVAALNLSLSASGATHTNGLFSYVYTYLYGDSETGFSPPAQITVAGNVDVNMADLPTRHSNCSAIRIYRTKAAGSTYFLLREIANDPTNPTISLSGPWVNNGAPDVDAGADGVPDGTTPTNLNDDADYAQVATTVTTTEIPKSSFYLAEHGRLLGIGIPDRRYDFVWSELGAPDVFLALSFVAVDGDKGPLNGMASSHGEILLSKNANGLSVLRGTDPSNWTLTENIHPTVGARDHWSFVHRYPVVAGQPYVLEFLGPDGVYEYAGQQVRMVSDDITPTIAALAVNTSTKASWITAEQAEFQSAADENGGASVNIQQDAYEQDGLREEASVIKIVDQLDYVGLWSNDNPLITGKMISVCKGPAEGEFYFGTDSDPGTIFRTTDNFLTKSAIAVGGASEYPVYIIQQTVGGATNLFIAMSTTASLGSLWRIQDPVGAAGFGPLTGQLASALNFKVSKGITQSSTSANITDVLVAFAGTFSPQLLFDSTNTFLWFVASDLDGSGNYRPRAKSVSMAGAVTNYISAGQLSSDTGYIAIANDGTTIWISYQETTSTSGTATCQLSKVPLATLVVADVRYPTALPSNFNLFVRRLSYNAQSGRIVAIGTELRNGNNKGFIYYFDTTQGALTELKEFTAASAYPLEIAYQTTTPYAHFVAMQAIDATETVPIYKVAKESALSADVTVYKTEAYESPTASAAVNGIISNLLFVAASGSSGGYLWADRLYFYGNAAVASNARMLQLGVPGSWIVQGSFTSKSNNLGVFQAFGSLDSEYSGQVDFYMRNAINAGALAATEKQVTPNQAIGGFNPTQPYAQWRVVLTWNYANDQDSPEVAFVTVNYFIGSATVPRPCAFHWGGRTYFSMAEDGEVENNVVIVQQKNGSWTIYRGWKIKGMQKFRGRFTAFQSYEFVELETGFTDMGNIIEGVAQTGNLASGMLVAMDDIEANVEGSQNPDFPNKSGFVVVTPMKGETPGDFPRVIEIPQSPSRQIYRKHGEPVEDFGWDWAQSWSLEIRTSPETSGPFAPYPSQQEVIQRLDLSLLTAPVGREYTGD